MNHKKSTDIISTIVARKLCDLSAFEVYERVTCDMRYELDERAPVALSACDMKFCPFDIGIDISIVVVVFGVSVGVSIGIIIHILVFLGSTRVFCS